MGQDQWSKITQIIYGQSKKPMNPFWSRIHRLLWCTMIRVIKDDWSWSRLPQRNAPLARLLRSCYIVGHTTLPLTLVTFHRGWSVAWQQRETMQGWYPAEIPDDENTSKILGQLCAITYKWPKQGKKYGHSRLIFYSHVSWAHSFVAIVWGSEDESPQGAPDCPDKGSALAIARSRNRAM